MPCMRSHTQHISILPVPREPASATPSDAPVSRSLGQIPGRLPRTPSCMTQAPPPPVHQPGTALGPHTLIHRPPGPDRGACACAAFSWA